MNPTVKSFVLAAVVAVAFGLVIDQAFLDVDAPVVGDIVATCVGLLVVVVGTIALRILTGVNNLVGELAGRQARMGPIVFIVSAVLATIDFGVVYLVASLLKMSGLPFVYVVAVAWLWVFYIVSLVLRRFAGFFSRARD